MTQTQSSEPVEWLVRWEIDGFAATPREAAIKALETQRDPDSTAVVFHVIGPDGVTHQVDLYEEDV